MGPRVFHANFRGWRAERLLRVHRWRTHLHRAIVCAVKISISRRIPCSPVIAAFLLICVHRLPAPIVEETPAPPREQQRPSKHAVRSKAKDENGTPATKQPTTSKRGKFGGIWQGKLNQGVWGDWQFTLTFNASGTSVSIKAPAGTSDHSTACDGNIASWRTGIFNEVAWTFTPNSDGMTAAVTAQSGLGINGTATFRRVSLTPAAPATMTAAPRSTPTAVPGPTRQLPLNTIRSGPG